MTLVDDRGRAYLFKHAPTGEIAAELLAGRVRRLGRQPHIPSVQRCKIVAGHPRLAGLVQPRVDVVGALSPHPGDWSALQRSAVLRDHPWEWLLGNFDTHIDQYVLVGPDRVPINVDWDHSLIDLRTTELNRYNRRSAAVIPVRNLLYAEYVAGRVDLDVDAITSEARRISRVPFEKIRALLRRWAQEAGVDEGTRRQVTSAIRARHATILGDFEVLVASLRRERRAARSGSAGWRRVFARVRDAWQRVVVVCLHQRVVRPALALRRRLAMRSLRT